MDGECEEMMVAKFGCIVDIEKLETVTVNRAIEELKEKLRMTEIQCSEEVVEWNVSLTLLFFLLFLEKFGADIWPHFEMAIFLIIIIILLLCFLHQAPFPQKVLIENA